MLWVLRQLYEATKSRQRRKNRLSFFLPRTTETLVPGSSCLFCNIIKWSTLYIIYSILLFTVYCAYKLKSISIHIPSSPKSTWKLWEFLSPNTMILWNVLTLLISSKFNGSVFTAIFTGRSVLIVVFSYGLSLFDLLSFGQLQMHLLRWH